MNRALVVVAFVSLTFCSAARAEELAPSPGSTALSRALLGRQVAFGVGARTNSYGFRGGQFADVFTTQHVDARWLFGGVTLEGGFLHTLPLATGGAAQSFAGHLRLGWTGRRGSLTVGALAQLAPAAIPSVQWLPTVTAAWAFDRFGLSAGLFDLQGAPIARVSFEQEHYGVGYVAPLGAEAHARLPLDGPFSLQVQALAFRAMNAQVLYLGVSGAFDGEARQAGGAL